MVAETRPGSREIEVLLVNPLEPCLPRGSGDQTRWLQLYGSAKALAIAKAAECNKGVTVVITADSLNATQLEEEIRFFVGTNESLPILHFPDWETLPYDRFSPYQDIVSDRIATLAQLPRLQRGILVTPVTTLMHHLPPNTYIEAQAFLLRTGAKLDREILRERLERCGYRAVSQVIEHGDFAVRGSIIDLFPMGSSEPYRIDLFDDEIDSIRVFDPETQRSTEVVKEIRLLPAREFPLSEQGIQQFRGNWRLRFAGNPAQCSLYKDVSQGLAAAGIEYYLPLFFEQTATLFDYLGPATLIVMDAGIYTAAENFWKEIGERYEQLRHDVERPLLPPTEVFLQTDEIFGAIRKFATIAIQPPANTGNGQAYATRSPAPLPIDAKAPQPLARVQQFIQDFGGRILIAAESKGRRETLLEMFRQHGIKLAVCENWQDFIGQTPLLMIGVAPLREGAVLESPRLAIVSETQLFGERALQQRRRQRSSRDPEQVIRNLTEIVIGAPVVHEEHGVGRYLGLLTMDIGGMFGEFIAIEYADNDKLYVPVGSLHLISRYSGIDPEHAPLHKLGSGQWQRARKKAAERIRDVAAELLEVYAKRAARKGHGFGLQAQDYQLFAQSFPFEETPDQETAIAAVLHDMQAEKPMDRLVCGDVGFGKTEVAMRAAFIAANGGKQVAFLVPTTLLAQQHYQNFKDRFADWPIRIEQLSRFRSKKEQAVTLEAIANGRVDIVVGTHKLLQDDINFKRLGLVILDEEHRFGVRQKERLKALRTEVDILTLTATPIPRTLNLALLGTRDLSIIATPPARRLAVKTFIAEWNDQLLREAMLREISRGGQVYFLHNEVETIEKTAATISSLMPEARVGIAHGQMRERELEQVMLDFYHRRYNVLVCSTIIESGIDVPTANTIIMNRADKLGLAQLYQLRGRVGRSHHRAYAYLLVPSKKALKGDALKRLEAIESLEELGMGFTLATHDLEIRGAGEILGEEQSGHIQEIGFSLYMDLLERAVKDLKAGRQPQLEKPAMVVEIDLHVPALLPDDYLPDVHARLVLYKRVACAVDAEELNIIKEEVIDRFGVLPEAANNLFRITELKLRATELGIRKVDLAAHGGSIQFQQDAVDPGPIIALAQRYPKLFRLDPSGKLKLTRELPDAETRIQVLIGLFESLVKKALS